MLLFVYAFSITLRYAFAAAIAGCLRDIIAAYAYAAAAADALLLLPPLLR